MISIASMKEEIMARRIVIIQGHPDPQGGHLCNALAEAYAKGATAEGHEVESFDIARLDVPILRNKIDFDTGNLPASLQPVQEAIARADHLVIVYPLWLGTMPALLKAFLEQIFRARFVFKLDDPVRRTWSKPLAGKSARIIVTMGMPAFFYRFYYGAHSLRSLERNILGMCGIGPTKETLCGNVEGASERQRWVWLTKMERLGRQGI